jgi:hypothetical protein
MRMDVTVVVLAVVMIVVMFSNSTCPRRRHNGTDRQNRVPMPPVRVVFVSPKPVPMSDGVVHVTQDTTTNRRQGPLPKEAVGVRSQSGSR